MTAFLTPVGRLVNGSLYEPQTEDINRKLIVMKSGANQDKPGVKFFFAIAIPKKEEQHWAQTQWGRIIHEEGQKAFPNGQWQHPDFAWKIVDGDSTIPNKTTGVKPCARPGYAGCWVLNFSTTQAKDHMLLPRLVNRKGDREDALEKPGAIKLGYYIAVFGSVEGNMATQQPGVYMNYNIISFQGFGEEIVLGPDPKTVGFDKLELPAGAQPTPINTDFQPITNTTQANTELPQVPVIAATPVYVTPHTQILNAGTSPASVNVPAVPQSKRVLTEKAQGATYEQLIQGGWTDALLIQQGLMLA